MTSRDRLDAAHRRVRGQLVATPIVGGPCVPGRACPQGLRLKLDLLQPGGSTWFRGAMHALTRELGRAKGVVAHGAFRPVFAWATAAALQRVPTIAVIAEQDLLADDRRALLAALAPGLSVVTVVDPGERAVRADELQRAHGYVAAAGIGDADFDDGVATLGLELADALPSDVERVLIAPATLAPPIAAGLAVRRREISVVGVDPAEDRRDARDTLVRALRAGLRICCDAEGVAALDVALDAPDAGRVCAVIAE